MATFRIPNQFSSVDSYSLVMDLPSQLLTTNPAQLDQALITDGNNQHWELVSVGNGIFKIVSQASGKVVEVNTSTNAVQQNSDAGTTIQQWQLFLANDDGITFQIINQASITATPKAIDLNLTNAITPSGGNGTPLVQSTASGATSQHWQLIEVD